MQRSHQKADDTVTDTLSPQGRSSVQSVCTELRPDQSSKDETLTSIYRRITGHELMSLFPAPSPLSSRMQRDGRCRAFEEQERAFFSERERAPCSPHLYTNQAYNLASQVQPQRCSPDTDVSSALYALEGIQNTLPSPPCQDSLPSNDTLSAQNHLVVNSGGAQTERLCKTQTRTSSIVKRRNAQRPQGKSFPSPPKPPSIGADVVHSESECEMAATEARRVEKDTGITWVEVEYRLRNPKEGPQHTFSNIVTN